MISAETVLLILALVFGFYMAWNIGANDVANALGTSVGSGALTIRRAVILAAICEFSGAFIAGRNVSSTVMKGMVRPDVFSHDPLVLALGMLAALLASGAWLQLASYNGWPVSTTHSIVGAVVGFGAVYGGLHAVYWNKVAHIALSWLLSPLISASLAFVMFKILSHHIFYRSDPVRAARKVLPIVVFLLANLLTLYLSYKGLRNKHHFSLLPVLLSGTLIGAVGAFWVYRAILRLSFNTKAFGQETHADPRVLTWLEKSSKHLKKVRGATTGEQKFQVTLMLDDIEDISSSIRQGTEKKASSSEYQAVESIFAKLQFITAAMMAFGHGANDVANAIGPLAAIFAIVDSHTVVTTTGVPTWILVLGGVGIVIGLATWGWRVIHTIGKKITQLTPSRGFSAEFGAATTILGASQLGMPISTTHTLVGAVLGVGLARGINAINLTTVRDILISWIITIPAGAILAIIFFYSLRLFF